MMFDLTGMTALVTGASGGLGSSIAKSLAAQGARLAVSGSNVEKLESFRAGLGGDHVALPCNLSDGASVDQLVPQAVEALGKLDILVNNAGVTKDNLLMRMKDEEFEDVIRINLEAAFRVEGGPYRHDQVGRPGTCEPRNHGECDRSRLHDVGNDGGAQRPTA
jgi:3-oxoacyl-[acyl-carrier protein] reductase